MNLEDIEFNKKYLITLVIIFALLFLIKEQYGYAMLCVGLIILISKLKQLKKFELNTAGSMVAEFDIPREKIEEDIKENHEKVSKKTFVNFKKIEETVLSHISAKIGGSMKRQIHYIYGIPPNTEFSYTPDATFQTDKELIFIEIKFISKRIYLDKILNSSIKQLKLVLEKIGPSSGDKKLVAKLVLATNFFVDVSKLRQLPDIEIIHYQL